MIFKGTACALVTPFTETNEVDFDKLGVLIDDQLAARTEAILVCSATGESSTLSDNERISIIEFAVKRVSGQAIVIAATGTNDTRHSLELSIRAMIAGANALYIPTPYYNRCNKKGLKLHFEMIAKSVPLPIIIENSFERTGVELDAMTVCELSEIDNIVGICDTDADLVRLAQIRELTGDDFGIYAGKDSLIIPYLAFKADGVFSIFANIDPLKVRELVDCVSGEDLTSANKIYREYSELFEALHCDIDPIPIKTAMNMMEYDLGEFRLPLSTMNPDDATRLALSMKKVGLLED